MKKKILFIQPFLIEKYQDQKVLTEILLIWYVYLENYLKQKLSNIVSDILYLPLEQKKGRISVESYSDKATFFRQMDELVSDIKFTLDSDTYVCISGTTSYYYLSVKIIAEYFQEKHQDSKVIFGGAHAIARPECFHYKNSPIDYLILGEGEKVFYEVVKKSFKKQDIPKLLMGPPVLDLNKLPDLDLSILNKYINNFRSLSICLSRGCPYNCTFCMERELAENFKFVKRWRSYSPKRAINECRLMIEYGQNNGIQDFGFVDPTFAGGNKHWMKNFLDLWDFQEDYNNVWIETRFDILNDDLIETLQKKHFFVWYGLESCSKSMLKIMNKHINPTKYLEKVETVIKKHKELDYITMLNVIFNHPGETKKTFKDSFDGLEKIKYNDISDSIYFSPRYYHHFPGTRIYNKINNYMNKFKTIIAYPKWWESENLLRFGPYMVRASSSLKLHNLIRQFSERYALLNQLSINNLKKNKSEGHILKILDKKKKTKSFTQLSEDLYNFMSKNKLEDL
ncbi:MAG: radical SAM protein [Candidatus Lokiarchaeota archaeon]|nr:radical SAM protein [Candidatus Lokiarchaeota archaeon]